MALITCGKCGKKVSNTRSTCFQCGAKIYFTEEINIEAPAVINEFEETPEVTLPVFSSLSEDEQIDLENEFISKDKRARKYRRTGAEIKKFGFIGFWLLLFGRLLFALQSYIIVNVFDEKIYQPKLIEWSNNILAVLVIIWLLAFIMCIYSSITFKNRLRKCIYMKKFQKWLKDEKNINYIPNLITEKDRKTFNQIDLNTMDC